MGVDKAAVIRAAMSQAADLLGLDVEGITSFAVGSRADAIDGAE